MILSSLIKNCFDRIDDEFSKKKLIDIFDNLELNNEIKAVSYTHLDVYKRQIIRAGRPRVQPPTAAMGSSF